MTMSALFVAASTALFLATTCRGVPIPKPLDLPGNDLVGPLRFKADGTFQISVFQDTHFGENAWDVWGPQQDQHTVRVMESVLDAGRPDLVVLNGDLTTGENLFLENATDYVDMMVAPMVERGLPWASTYGNHDHQYNISGASILEREARYPNSRTQQMVHGPGDRNVGISNYYLPVFPADCLDIHACAPELLLWFFDSRGGYEFQQREGGGEGLVSLPNWVDETVAEWFKHTSAGIAARFNRTIPSLGFVHIPTHASQVLQLGGDDRQGVDPNRQPGLDNDRPLAQQAQGWCPDGTHGGAGTCPYGGQDAPFMRAVASTPGMMGLFSGHDHGNTWCYKWSDSLGDDYGDDGSIQGNGVNLCFGQHTGYGGYSDWIRGGRQIHLTRDQLKRFELDTWNLLEDGRSVGSVSLNSTYGMDSYPEVHNDETFCDCDYTNVTPGPGS